MRTEIISTIPRPGETVLTLPAGSTFHGYRLERSGAHIVFDVDVPTNTFTVSGIEILGEPESKTPPA